MDASWEYCSSLCRRAEEIGYDLTLIAELNLNDIKGVEAESLDAWSTAAALAAVTTKLELMVAVRPTFHAPATLAKQAANIDRISGGRLSLNVVSSWWRDESTKYGVQFDEHEMRYARTSEWIDVVDGCWSGGGDGQGFTHEGELYQVRENVLSPKPCGSRRFSGVPAAAPTKGGRPTLYAGGESETAKNLIAAKCDAYLMHGDPPEMVGKKIADMRERRERLGLGPMTFGVAGVCDCAGLRARGRGGSGSDYECECVGTRVCQLSAMDYRVEVGADGVAGGLFGFESGAEGGVCGDAGSG